MCEDRGHERLPSPPDPDAPASVRFTMPLPLFRLSPDLQRDWIRSRGSPGPAPPAATGLSDGFRLPGPRRPDHARGRADPDRQPAGRPHGAADRAQPRPARSSGPDQLSRRRIDPIDADAAAAGVARGAGGVGLRRLRHGIGPAFGLRDGHGLPRAPDRGLGRAAVRPSSRPGRGRRAFEVPLASCSSRRNQQRHFGCWGTRRRDFFAIPYGERYIWGATAAMLDDPHRTLGRELTGVASTSRGG